LIDDLFNFLTFLEATMTQTQKTTQKTKTTATNKKDRRYELAKLRQQVKACGYDYRQVRSMSRGELESILLACKDKSEKKSEKKSVFPSRPSKRCGHLDRRPIG